MQLNLLHHQLVNTRDLYAPYEIVVFPAKEPVSRGKKKFVGLVRENIESCKVTKRVHGEISKDDVAEQDVNQHQRVQVVPRQCAEDDL